MTLSPLSISLSPSLPPSLSLALSLSLSLPLSLSPYLSLTLSLSLYLSLSLSLSISLSLSRYGLHMPCRTVDISTTTMFCLFVCLCLFLSVINCKSSFAWQPVVHLQSLLVSHNLATLSSTYRVNTSPLFLPVMHSHNQPFISSLPVPMFCQLVVRVAHCPPVPKSSAAAKHCSFIRHIN